MPKIASAQNIDYVINDRVIHITVSSDDTLSDQEKEVFEKAIASIAKYIPKESFLYLEKNDKFWIFIQMSDNKGGSLGYGRAKRGTENSLKQFSEAIDQMTKEVISSSGV